MVFRAPAFNRQWRARAQSERNCPARVLIIVENRPAGMDNRVSKQISSLLRCGYDVCVISQRHPSNDQYRANPAVRLLEYPAPPEPVGVLGYIVEYAYSFLMAAVLSIRTLLAIRIDIVQFCQPPDVYFLLAPLFRAVGARIVV